MKPKIIIFATGSKTGGGSGFENLVTASRRSLSLDSARDNSQTCELDADIIAVVSNHEHGGVREKADRLGVPFYHFSGPYTAEGYSNVLQKIGTTGDKVFVALSGWLKMVQGLDPKKTFNIHPALLSFDHGRFGGKGLYGHYAHEAVLKALDAGEIHESGCSMHFVTDEYDRGPVFFEKRTKIEKGMTADDIARVVNAVEHEWQPIITNMVVHEEIVWDGKDPASLQVPPEYSFLPTSK